MKPRCIIYAFFNLKKDVPKPLLAQVITFIATKQLENSGKILRSESNVARNQPMCCEVSTFVI